MVANGNLFFMVYFSLSDEGEHGVPYKGYGKIRDTKEHMTYFFRSWNEKTRLDFFER